MESLQLNWIPLLFLCIFILLPACRCETSLNDILSAADEGIGIIDIRSEGRTDVKTNLKLSPWELFVLSDLVLKLATKKCPKMNTEVITSFKQILSDSFKQAPQVEIQNELFLPSYSHLVRCLDYIDEMTVDNKASLNQKEEMVDSSVKSDEDDWMAKEAFLISTTSTTTTEKSSSKDENKLASSWLWGFRTIHEWVLRIFTQPSKNLELSEEKQMRNMLERREKIRNMKQQTRVNIAYRKARQNFANFFHEISRIVRKTCPAIHRPDKIFMRLALLDITTWVTLEQSTTISYDSDYFRKNELLKLAQDCLRQLERESLQN